MPQTPSDPLVSSARTASLLAVVIAYVGLALVWPYERISQELHTARRVLAVTLVRDLLEAGDSTERSSTERTFESLRSNNMYTRFGVRDFTMRFGAAMSPGVLLVEVSGHGPTWRLGLRAEDLQNDIDPEILRTSARRLGITVNENSDVVEVFERLQTLVIERGVELRALGLSSSVVVAPWLIAVSVIVLVLIVRNGISRAAAASDGGIGGIWIAIDKTTGLEACVAALWIAALGAAPIVATGCLMYMEAVSHTIVGAELEITDVIRVMSPVVLIAIGSWISATTVGRLLSLRSRRVAAA